MERRKSSKFLFSQIKSNIGWVIALCALNFVSSLISILLSLFSAQVIDVALGKAEGVLWQAVSLLIGTVVFEILLDSFSMRIHTVASCRINIKLTKTVFSRFIDKKYSVASSFHSGEILNRLTSDEEHVISGIIDILPMIVSIATRFIASMVIVIVFNWAFALVVVAVGTVGMLVARFFGKKFKVLHKECQTSTGMVKSFLQESTANLVVVKTFSNDAPLLERLRHLTDKDYRNKIKRNNISILTNTSARIIFVGGYYAALAWGALQVATGALSFGSLTAFLQIVSNLRAPFLSASGILSKYFSAVASAERIDELLHLEDDEPLLPEISTEGAECIHIDSVSFSYSKKDALINCTADIPIGKMTSLVGDSGAGKSTLFRLMLGLYEQQSGSIDLVYSDGRQLPVSAATRSLFTYVPQGNFLLTGTVRENIAFFNDNISEEKIIEAAKAAEIYDVIAELPDGFDTAIGERGHGLSEGQVQRIAIARALLFDAPILLLDECTSAVDGDTERRILENIKELKGKTVVIITHRPQALKVSDHILKIKDETIETLS